MFGWLESVMGALISKAPVDAEQDVNDDTKTAPEELWKGRSLSAAKQRKPKARKRRKTKATKPEECSWNSLPHELQGLILSQLDDEYRCRVIPLVSRALLDVHKQYPPRRTEWFINQRVTPSIVSWFRGIAPSLERLQVLVEGPGLQGQLPELLATAVGTSPQLRSLSLNGVWEGRSILKSVSGLSNLTELVLETWEFPSSGDVTEMRYLSGLKSLETLDLPWLHVNDATMKQMATFWGALAKLRSLRAVRMLVCAECGVEDLPYFFDKVSLLTQITALSVTNVYACLDANWELPSIGRLTQLRTLEILDTGPGLPCSCLRNAVEHLPHLEHLSLHLSSPVHPASFSLTSRELTSLAIRGGGATMVEHLLHPSTPALPHLRALELSEMPLHDFPASLASALRSLTSLTLADDAFETIPAPLSRITTLHTLDLTGNAGLQLRPADVATLGCLPQLRCLGLARRQTAQGPSGFCQEGLGVLIEICQRWPDLRLKICQLEGAPPPAVAPPAAA